MNQIAKQEDSRGLAACLRREAEFWSRVQSSIDGCWTWAGATRKKGYGAVSLGTHHILAHRFSWTVHFGSIPDGLCVLHKCDNPPCVRPDHLFLGTNRDNVADRVAKGRSAKQAGDKHPQRKLCSDDVREIRKLRGSGFVMSAIADRFGVSLSTIEQIIYGTTWKSVT